MGDAADDARRAAEREDERNGTLARACPCPKPVWIRDDEDGLMECQTCGTVVDE